MRLTGPGRHLAWTIPSKTRSGYTLLGVRGATTAPWRTAIDLRGGFAWGFYSAAVEAPLHTLVTENRWELLGALFYSASEMGVSVAV